MWPKWALQNVRFLLQNYCKTLALVGMKLDHVGFLGVTYRHLFDVSMTVGQGTKKCRFRIAKCCKATEKHWHQFGGDPELWDS